MSNEKYFEHIHLKAISASESENLKLGSQVLKHSPFRNSAMHSEVHFCK